MVEIYLKQMLFLCTVPARLTAEVHFNTDIKQVSRNFMFS